LRDDILINVVSERCELLKRSQFWLGEPRIRPNAWLNNFKAEDKKMAALLLDRFVFCNDKSTNSMLMAAWASIGDGMNKSLYHGTPQEIVASLNNVVFTPVEGEEPNPTDSGNFMCRKARQILGVPSDLIVRPYEAIDRAANGCTVVFLDDIVGSGDQFMKSWNRRYSGDKSFKSLAKEKQVKCIYVTLVTTEAGLTRINLEAPQVLICSSHILTKKSSIGGLTEKEGFNVTEVKLFLEKYSRNLTPIDSYMYKDPNYLKFGYKNLGLFMGFEHSIPDGTLPIFWSTGKDGWEPLIERR
jgi:hypothetical protein